MCSFVPKVIDYLRVASYIPFNTRHATASCNTTSIICIHAKPDSSLIKKKYSRKS